MYTNTMIVRAINCVNDFATGDIVPLEFRICRKQTNLELVFVWSDVCISVIALNAMAIPYTYPKF